jgi:proteasome activator subunit 4
VVLGSGKRCLATKRSWEVIGQLWPAIVQAQQSEKPSILRVVDDIIAKVSKNLESPGIEIKVIMFFFIYRSYLVVYVDYQWV